MLDLIMKKLIIFIFLFAPALAWSGDEYQIPQLREGSAYQSRELMYRVVGIEDRGSEIIVWAVATPEDVLTQKSLNRIIKDIRQKVRTEKRDIGFTKIWFYRSVGDSPEFPAFRITDLLADYSAKKNKTWFGPAAKSLYGGWAYGPSR